MEVEYVLGLVGFFLPLTCCLLCVCSRKKKVSAQSSTGPIIGEEFELEEAIPPYTITIQPPTPPQIIQPSVVNERRPQTIVNPMQFPVHNQIDQESPEVTSIPPFIFPTLHEEERHVVNVLQSDDLPEYESIDPPSYAQAIRGTLYENGTNNNSQT